MATNTTPAKSRIAAAMDTSASKASVYTAQELAENHKTFGTSYEIVAVALRLAGKSTFTFAEAQNIINKFKNKEVK